MSEQQHMHNKNSPQKSCKYDLTIQPQSSVTQNFGTNNAFKMMTKWSKYGFLFNPHFNLLINTGNF